MNFDYGLLPNAGPFLLSSSRGRFVVARPCANDTGWSFHAASSRGYALPRSRVFVVAVDLVGVGIGERVLVVNGSSARMTDGTRDKSIDSAIVAKVDTIQVET